MLAALRAGARFTRGWPVGIVAFPAFNALASLLTELTLQLPVVALAVMFGPQVGGLYGLDHSGARSAQFIARSSPGAGVLRDCGIPAEPDAPTELTERTALGLLVAGAPIFTLIRFAGSRPLPDHFWSPVERSRHLRRPLGYRFLGNLITRSPSAISSPYASGRVANLVFSMIEFSSELLALAVGHFFRSADLAVALLGFTYVLFTLVSLHRFFRAADASLLRPLQTLRPRFGPVCSRARQSCWPCRAVNAVALFARSALFLVAYFFACEIPSPACSDFISMQNQHKQIAVVGQPFWVDAICGSLRQYAPSSYRFHAVPAAGRGGGPAPLPAGRRCDPQSRLPPRCPDLAGQVVRHLMELAPGG